MKLEDLKALAKKRIQNGLWTSRIGEVNLCPLCKNTGVHICPDVVPPILIRCSHKECFVACASAHIDALIKIAEAAKCFLEREDTKRWNELSASVQALESGAKE